MAVRADGTAAPAAMRTEPAAFSRWTLALRTATACSTAFTAAAPQTTAASPVAAVGALEHPSAAASPGTTAEPATAAVAGATACPTGCAAAAAANGRSEADEGRRSTDSRSVYRGTEQPGDSFSGCGASSSAARYCGIGAEQSDPSSVCSLPSSSSAATVCEGLPASSLFTLPRCSAVRALVAVRTHQEQQWQSRQPQQPQQLQQGLREVQTTQERERQLQRVEQQAVGRQRPREQRQEERRSSSSEGSNRGRSSRTDDTWRSRLLRVGDSGAGKISLGPEQAQTTHRRRKEWDREDVDDPILTDFSSLEEEAFPYPLPCCSFFELLPSDEPPPVECLQGLPQGLQQGVQLFRELQEQPEQDQQDRQQQQQALQQQQLVGRGNKMESGVLLQLQEGEEQHPAGVSQAQLLGEGQRPRQEQHQRMQEDMRQPRVEYGKADAELQRKRKLYFTPAYTTETDVYNQLLQRHFGKQKTARRGEEDRLPAALGREYLNFQPPPAFEPTELRPQTFRERVSAIRRDIESLCIPPPPHRCPLRFSKFILHAQRLTAALAAAYPRPVAGRSARAFDADAAAGIALHSNSSGSTAAATNTAATCMVAAVGWTADSSAAAATQRTGGSSTVPVFSAAPDASRPGRAAGLAVDDVSSSAAAAVSTEASCAVNGGAGETACRAEDAALVAEGSCAAAVVAGAADLRPTSCACVVAGDGRGSRRETRAGDTVAAASGDRASSGDVQKQQRENTPGACHAPSTKQYQVESAGGRVAPSGEGGSFCAAALRAVADYFGFFAVAGLRAPSLDEAVACCVAEELRGWPEFLDPSTMKILKDVLAHSKARRFNRFPCRLAWPPIPPLCTYSESNLRCSMRQLVSLKTYSLVQDYYRTRFHRQTSIHNFAVDQHGIEQRKLAAAEARCRQRHKTASTNETQREQQQLHTAGEVSQSRQNETLPQKKQDRWWTEGKEERHAQWSTNHHLQSPHLSRAGKEHLHLVPQQQQQQQEGHDQHQEQANSAYGESTAGQGIEYSDFSVSFSAPSFIFDRCASSRTSPQSELDFFRRVSHDEAIISVAFYHAARGTKLAVFDVLSTQTLLDVRTAFLGCCEAESEPGIPVFPGSCFLIDGILYPDTSHESSGPEYAETIAEHLSGSGKLAKKRRIPSSVAVTAVSGDPTGSGAFGRKAAGGGELRIIPPRRRLDGSVRVARPALPQRSSVSSGMQEKQQQEESCTYVPSSNPAKVSRTRRESRSSRVTLLEVTRDKGAGVIENNKAATALSTGGAWDEQRSLGPSSTYAAVDDAFGEELHDDEEGNDWITIPQHKAVLNDMQLPLRSLECFVHQGTCEHRVIFWNIRQFDPKRDCCYVAAYPIRTYKPSSKAVTCQACDEHLACKGVLNSILCSVHNPTYLCENCYSVLFGGATGRNLKKPTNALGYRGGGKAPFVTLVHREKGTTGGRDLDVNTDTDGDAAEEEGNDDPDPFALHFDVYDG